MSARQAAALWAAQRLSAVVLGVCVLVHLMTMVYAVRGGLTAAEILARTRGNAGWAVFYGVFVLAAALHGAIGLRTILAEWAGLRGRAGGVVAVLIGVALAMAGVRAILAVTLAP